jgi:hypothetical protein
VGASSAACLPQEKHVKFGTPAEGGKVVKRQETCYQKPVVEEDEEEDGEVCPMARENGGRGPGGSGPLGQPLR